jgi:hypothetical protein
MTIDTVSAKPLEIGVVLGDTFAVIGRNVVVLANIAVMFNQLRGAEGYGAEAVAEMFA